MNVDRLLHFTEVIRFESFTKAANRLKLTQPALSKSIRLLEEEVGSQLLVRKRSGVKPTGPGKQLFAEAERILREIDGIKALLKPDGHPFFGELRLGASDNVSNHLLPRIWSSFVSKHPGVRLTVFSGTSEAIQNELLSGRAEAGISYHESGHPRVRSEKLADIEFVIISATPLKQSQLSRVPFIGSIANDYKTPYAALRILRELGIRPGNVIQANQQEVQVNMALHGLGFTVVPRFMVSELLGAGRLRVVPVLTRPKVPLYFSVVARAQASALSEKFREHLNIMLPGLL